MKKITREEALAYHTGKRKGKTEVIPTKPCVTQRDLSLAFSMMMSRHLASSS